MKRNLFIVIFALILLYALPAQATYWETITTPNFKIYYPPDQPGAAKTLAKNAEGIRSQTLQAIGYDFKHQTRVYLAPDRETYESIQPRAKIPEWSVGVAFENENLIVIYTPRGARRQGFNYDMLTVFHHEYCHIALGMALRDVKIPRWLDEGFAKYHAHEWSTADSFNMTIAVLSGRLIPLGKLMYSFPKSRSKAKIAYLQSKTFVAYLERMGILRPMIHMMQQGTSAQDAIYKLTGKTVDELEQRWIKYLKRTHTWIFFLLRGQFIWPAMALLFLFVYWRVRVRMKKKLRRMALEDEIEDHYHDGYGMN